MASEVVRKGRVEIDARVKGEAQIEAIGDGVSRMDKNLGKAGKTMVAAQLATKALTAGFSALKGAIGTTLENALNWEDWVGRNTVAVDGMSNAVGGMIDKLTLARTATKLQTGELQATQSQMEALTKAAIQYARVNKIDFAPALRAVTDAVVGGRSRALKEVGILIDFVGTAAQKSQAALDKLVETFGESNIEATNTNEQLAIMKSRLIDLSSELGAAALQGDFMKRVFNDLNWVLGEWQQRLRRDKTIPGLKDKLRATNDEIGRLQANIEKVKDAPFLAFAPGTAQTFRKMLTEAMGRREKIRAQIRGLEEQARIRGVRENLGAMEQASRRVGLRIREKGIKPTKAKPAGIDVEQFRGEPAGELEADAARLRGEQMIDQQIRAADATSKINAEMRTQNELTVRLADSIGQTANVMKDANADMSAMAIGGLAQMAGGMWDVVDAALAGEMSIGKAVAAMLKSVLMGVAKEATVKAVFQLAEGFAALGMGFGFPTPKSIAHFTAAAKYGTVAAIAGTAGLAIGAASRGAGGGGARADRGTGGAAGSPSRPSVGRDRKSEERTFAPVVNVYLDAQNPAAGLHWKKQVAAQLREAA